MEYILKTKDYKKFKLTKKDILEPILFEDANFANGCFNGDTVNWTIDEGCRLFSRGEHPILSGVLELNSRVKYGVTNRGISMYLFVPYRREYPNLVVGCSERILTHNKIVLVRVEDSVPSGRSLPRGNLIDILGISGDPKAERAGILWAHTPYKMPNALLKIEPPVHEKRREYELRPQTPKHTFHIDPPGCKDVDDVISIERVDDSTHRIWITISDVAEWIPLNSEIDLYAKKVSATTYDNGNPVRPMLPPAYSEKVCSLLPGKQSLGISLVMDWNGSSLENLMFLKTVVQVERSYTYDQADADINGIFSILKKITTFLTKQENPDSHKIIEVLMILYNREVANVLKKATVGIMRRHDSVDITKWEKFESISPDLGFLAYKSAEYCSADSQYLYHSGLGSDAYCTATSPIRRYADLVNQRILKSFLGLTISELKEPDIDYEWMNKRQKELKRFERDMFCITNMLHNEKRIVKGILLDWTQEDNGRIRFHVYISEWKRIIKWTTTGRLLSEDRAICILNNKNTIMETIVEKTMNIRFEVFWNTQTRYWKDKLILRIA